MGKLVPEMMYSTMPDDEHRAAWRQLEENAFAYPDGLDVQPMKPGKEGSRGLKWAGLELVSGVCDRGVVSDSCGAVLSVGGDIAIVEAEPPATFAVRLAAALFTHKARGTVYVCADGARRELHLLFRACYREWTALGYTVSPSGRGVALSSISVRKAKHAWHVADLTSVTGLDSISPDNIVSAFCPDALAGWSRAQRVCVAVGVFAEMVASHFGVPARLTAGRTAVSALARHVPDSSWLWRPSALAVTLSRFGGAYRGGYCYYPPYRGPGHKVDIRRAYVWALSQEIPNGYAVGACLHAGVERPGLYVCRVRGPGIVPVLLAPFDRSGRPPTRRLWNADQCIAALPSSEFAGLRALGYRVEPGVGAVAVGVVSFRGFVAQIEAIGRAHGFDSPQGLIGKSLGVRAYGKLAERPAHQSVMFSADDPGGDWFPMVDAAGEEVDDAYTAERTEYRSHQHVDTAAHIAGLVRSKLYAGVAAAEGVGIHCLAADTDGLLLSDRPYFALDRDLAGVGAWRYNGLDPDVIIAGNRLASIDGRVLAAGTSPQPAEVVAYAYDHGTVTVEGKVMAAPWSGRPGSETVTRTLRRA